MAKLNSRGFTAVTALLLIVILAAISATGWYMWTKRNKTQPSKSSAPSAGQQPQTPESVSVEDESSKWSVATTQAGGFSIRAPDGWKLTNFPGNFLGGVEITHKPGTPATIETSANEYAGHSLRFRANLYSIDNAELRPQWSSPQPGLEESTQGFSIGSLNGKRFKGIFSQNLNQTLYEYIFDVGNGRRLDIVYTIYHNEGEKDDVTTVEKAIKTITLQ